jgi:tripartite-type tricarboxylate transporter receptor subunit TctC
MKRHLAALAAAIACVLPGALPAQYPERPITFVVPFAAGGATDALGRAFAERIGRGAAQPILVENIAGAGGTVGAARVAKAKPDGYTYLVGHMGYMAAATGLYKELPYDPARDFEAVARFPDTPLVLICGRENRNAADIKSLMAYARANPGKLTIANAGVGSTGHLVAALFAAAAKAEVTHVAYKGNAPALTDIMGGRVDCMFDQSNTALPQVRGERVVGVATTSRDRLPQMPAVPTLSESGLPGFEAATWYGIYAPKGTERAQLQWVLGQFNAAMADTVFVSMLVEQGYVLLKPEERGPEALAAHTKSEIEKWKKVIAAAAIPPN